MKHAIFDKFPALWELFELRLKEKVLPWIAEKLSETDTSGSKKLSAVYDNVGFQFWRCDARGGALWVHQLEEVFFHFRYYSIIKLLYYYDDLDVLAAQSMENLNTKNVEEIYRQAVKPHLDARKQEMLEAFAGMAAELEKPRPYTLKLAVDDKETDMILGFQKSYIKRKSGGMDGYTYSFNGRIYKDVQMFTTGTVERLCNHVGITKDTYGESVLRRYTEIPTFDSSDREWDSEEIEYLMYDGRNINLVVMRGGYRIANLTFYEKLQTADIRMKTIFEKLGWSTDGITWT